jgi:hypothetical protein
MANRVASFFPDRVNCFVPFMAYDAAGLGLANAGAFRAELGNPAAISTTLIANATSIAATGPMTLASVAPIAVGTPTAAPYGRCLQLVLSGAGTPVIDVRGVDYLRQPMTERFTGTGTTPVIGNKAFFQVFSATIVSGTVATGTAVASIGTTDKLGLPFAAQLLTGSLINNATATAFTFVARDATAVTATTGDTRGTVLPGTATDGTRVYAALLELDKSATVGLHGLRHFTS